MLCRAATTVEIKAAYRKLALALHPDRHNGDEKKTKAFKEASEAYNILIDNDRRREYDMGTGWTPSGWHNKNRRRPPPANYRKVYAPHAPPDGKWHDAQRHYDMHYGDGFFHDAVNSAYKRAKANGEFDYHSPLGKGFEFETVKDRRARRNGQNSYYKNPYSKATQGPITQVYNYEESDEADKVLKRKKGVVDKLHERRKERQQKEFDKDGPITPGQKIYTPLNRQSNQDSSCVVM